MVTGIKGFDGSSLDEVASSVGKSMDDNKFESVIKTTYPRGMDDLTRLTLWVALYNNTQDKSREHFKTHYGVLIKSCEGEELESLSEEELIAANIEIGYKNESLEKAMDFLSEYKR